MQFVIKYTGLRQINMKKPESIDDYYTLLSGLKTLSEQERIDICRHLCKTDLYFLMIYGLNRKDMLDTSIKREWLLDRCREVQESPNGYLDLWSRCHYKTSIINTGLTIQDILNNPEITIGIFSFKNSIATAFLSVIKREFESNEVLRELFPDILYDNPKRDSPKWSEQGGIIVKRKGNPKESTIEAWGLIDGQPISKHYDLRIYDDVVTKENINTPEMMAKTQEAWELSLNLGTSQGVSRYLGTRYHFLDTYRVIMERGAAIPRVYPATDDGTPTGNPILYSKEFIEKQRKEQGSFTFSAQYLQNPIADSSQGFKEPWLKYYECRNERLMQVSKEMNVYILVDPASAKKKSSDFSVFIVIGCNKDGNYYLLDGIRDRLNLKEKADTLFELYKKWKPKNIGYERYGMMADVEYIREKQEDLNFRFSIQEVGGKLPKNDRIRRLVPKFENGQVYLPLTLNKLDYQGKSYDFVKQFIEEEYLIFPSAVHDDMLDSMSRIFDISHEFPMDDDDEDTFYYRTQEYDSTTGEPL